MASLGYLHPDIEWRHVGLLPIINHFGELTGLRPILIDMERAELVGQEVASAAMYTRIQELKDSLQNRTPTV
jgi:hypothetical protein